MELPWTTKTLLPRPPEWSNGATLLPQDPGNRMFQVVDVTSEKPFRVGDVDTKTLVQLVHKRSEIWDQRLPKHKNQPYVQQAWDDISQTMGIPVPIIRRKWKNLRDCYGVELAKPTESRWIHFKLLAFLRGFVQPRKKMKPASPPKDPLAFDSLDEDSVAEDPSLTMTGNDVNEEKFDPSKFEIVAVAPFPPSEPSPSVRIVAEVEPPAKKVCTDAIVLFNDHVQEPLSSDTADPLNAETNSDVSDSAVAFQTNKADVANFSHHPSYWDPYLNSDDASNSSSEMKNNLNPNRRTIITTRDKKKVYAGKNPTYPESLNMKSSCSVCSKLVDGRPAVTYCSNCSKLSAELSEPPNKVGNPQARSQTVHSSVEPNLKASNRTTRSEALHEEVDRKPEFDGGNDANMAAIDLTEDEATDDTTEDEDFFRSLLPHVRKIPPHLKLQFRNRLHDLVGEFAYPR